jgi:hypothetical protein
MILLSLYFLQASLPNTFSQTRLAPFGLKSTLMVSLLQVIWRARLAA